jgi:hypothetical protein
MFFLEVYSKRHLLLFQCYYGGIPEYQRNKLEALFSHVIKTKLYDAQNCILKQLNLGKLYRLAAVFATAPG